MFTLGVPTWTFPLRVERFVSTGLHGIRNAMRCHAVKRRKFPIKNLTRLTFPLVNLEYLSNYFSVSQALRSTVRQADEFPVHPSHICSRLDSIRHLEIASRDDDDALVLGN